MTKLSKGSNSSSAHLFAVTGCSGGVDEVAKGRKPDNFESHNSLKLSFTNIRGLCSNFVECGSFFESNSPDIPALCEINLDHSLASGDFSMRGYLPLFLKDCATHVHGLAVYVKEGLCGFLFMFSTGFTPFSVLLLFPLSTIFVFMHTF